MNKITKIVLTGGPCAGKTTALSRVIEKFTDKGYLVLALPEAATLFNQAGVNFSTNDKRFFHAAEKSLLQFQMEMEDAFVKIAEASDRPALIICDRGLMDVAAYLSNEEWQALLDESGLSTVQARDKRYDAVLHLVTAAKGAEKFYTTANNNSRTENMELARILDDKLIAAWTGHPHLRIVDNSTGFEGKINRVLAEISAVLGIPEPVETERKYAVELTGDLPAGNAVTEIYQTYLQSEDDEEVRLRKRGQNGHFVYFLTRKRKLQGNSRLETERQITPTEYVQHLSNADPRRVTIHKTRTCFVWENRYFELDTFVNPPLPFLLLEIEDAERHEDIKFPPFIKIIEDVTGNKNYYNASLALNKKPNIVNQMKIAEQIAKTAHKGQKDKQGVDYFLHPLAVSGFCVNPKAKIAALLHDVIEDTDVTAEILLENNISEDVVTAVVCLTKTEGESVEDYLRRVAGNDISIEVKFADMRHNSDITRFPPDMQDRALKNKSKYAGLMAELLYIVGEERTKNLTSDETYEHVMSCINNTKSNQPK